MAAKTVAAAFPAVMEAVHTGYWKISSRAAIYKRQITEETIHMKAIVVTDQAAGPAGMKLVERQRVQRNVA